MMTPCCKCKDRYIGCHGKCEKYKEWKRKYDSYISEINKERYKEADYNNYKAEVCRRTKKNGRKH